MFIPAEKHLLWIFFTFMYSINTITVAEPLDFKTHICVNSGNYTQSSTYEENLKATLDKLPTTNSGFGFFKFSSGQGTDRVSSAALCQGDTEPKSCLSCLNDAIIKLQEVCPNQKAAVGYYDACFLKYSDPTQVDSTAIIWNNKNALNKDQFIGDVEVLMNKLKAEAAAGGPLLKFATGNRSSPDSGTIYGLVQCTPDLSQMQCSDCLDKAYNQYNVPNYLGRTAVTVYQPMCIYSYKDFLFFKESTPVILAPPPSSPPLSPPPPGLQATPPILSPPPPKPAPRKKSNMVVVVIVTVTFGVIISASICIFLKMRRSRKKQNPMDIGNAEFIKYSLNQLKSATNNFSEDNKLGEGGFGPVYKGMLEKEREIAVKRLSRDSRQGEKEFKNEVLLLAELKHRNLVRLLGFCFEGCEQLLVYEFVPNASLDQFIFDSTKRTLLDWQKRYMIIKGIAKGLQYLHEGSDDQKIIHLDMKPSNVLLDTKMNPKIADFGSARLCNPEETRGQASKIVGTHGYMAPEYAMKGQYSEKSDAFSFGVMVLEIITGQKNQHFQMEESRDLLGFALKSLLNETTTNMIDPTLKTVPESLSDINRSIHIALLCVQENVCDRPTMSKVVLMLDSRSLPLPELSQHDVSLITSALPPPNGAVIQKIP